MYKEVQKSRNVIKILNLKIYVKVNPTNLEHRRDCLRKHGE